MDINISTLHFFNFTPIINTFKKDLPITQKNCTFYTVSNLFYADFTYTNTLKNWVEHFKNRKQNFVLARGDLQEKYKTRKHFKHNNTIWGLFKTPVTPESLRLDEVRRGYDEILYSLPKL